MLLLTTMWLLHNAASDHHNINQGCTHSDFWGRANEGYLNWPHSKSIILFYMLTMGWTNDLDCRIPNDNGVLSVPLALSTSWTLSQFHFISFQWMIWWSFQNHANPKSASVINTYLILLKLWIWSMKMIGLDTTLIPALHSLLHCNTFL